MTSQSFTEPFRHWILSGINIPTGEVPPPDWEYWVKYENDCEMHKRTCENLNLLKGWEKYFEYMDWMNMSLEKITGIKPLFHDLYGAGLHVTDPGGWLQPHLDYNVHPKTDMERRVNLVAFLNNSWNQEWGGAFELYDDAGREVVKRIYPEPRTAVVWDADGNSFHGTQKVHVVAPERATAAAYFVSPLRSGVPIRKRALFVPNRNKS